MIARREAFYLRLSKVEVEKMEEDAMAKFARIIQSSGVLLRTRRLRRLAATPSRDRSFGGNPPWDQLSYASREAVFPYLSLSASLSFFLFPSSLLSILAYASIFLFLHSTARQSFSSLSLSLSLSLTISVAYGTNSAHRLSAHTSANHERNQTCTIGSHVVRNIILACATKSPRLQFTWSYT